MPAAQPPAAQPPAAAQAGLPSGDSQGSRPDASPGGALTDFVTNGGIRVTRTAAPFEPGLLDEITRQVDDRRGSVLSSGMEYPGRYSRWHLAYVDPPVEIIARGRRVAARALNERGRVLMPVIEAALRRAGTPVPAGAESAGADPAGTDQVGTESAGTGRELNQAEVIVDDDGGSFTEEERSRRRTVFSALREVIAAFAGPDPHLGLYGAFGYDLAFQFEPVRLRRERSTDQRDLVLHIPDRLYALDRKRETATCYSYDFATSAGSTQGLPRATPASGSPCVDPADVAKS